MGNFKRECVLNWHGGGKKTVLFDPSTNTPIFTTAPSSRAYRVFATIFEALEAPYYRKETVLQYPGRHLMDDEPAFAPEEFVAEESLNFEKDASVCKAQAACPQWGNPQEAGNRHTTQMRWLPLQRDD